MGTLGLLVLLAFRNIRAHWLKSLLVGGFLFFGSFLFITGSALLGSVEASMQKSITSSLAGHLQLYDKNARDPLALFGDGSMGGGDIGEMNDFGPIEDAVMATDNVKDVVPMGQAMATVFGGNDIDATLDELRTAVKEGNQAQIDILSARIRTVVSTFSDEIDRREALTNNAAAIAEERQTLATVASAEFWSEFAANPVPKLDWLDSKLAPLAADGRLLYFRMLGTDLDQFTKTFDRFEIVDGQMVPPGKRGILLSKTTYERFVKNKVARDLDDIVRAVHKDGKTIAGDTALADKVARNARQYQRILFQLDPDEATDLETKLRALMPNQEGGLAELLQAFLTVTDETLDAHNEFFYKEIGPKIRLYEVKIGEEMPLRAFTKAGYLKSISVRVYGTYQFKGLEDSTLAGAMNLTDMLTFREMYGKMSDDQRKELSALSAQAGVKQVSRENAEDELFGGGGGGLETVAEAPAANFDEFSGAAMLDRDARQKLVDSVTITRDEIAHGLALNAAVILKDPSKLEATKATLSRTLEPLGVQVVDWRQAAGIVGQFITVLQITLYIFIGVTMLAALVVINITMVMTTLDRTGEIGTMRAVGAQRGFVIVMFVLETLVLGLLAGVFATGASGLLIAWLHSVGIPAPSDIVVVLFAGKSLYPVMTAGNVLLGLTLIVVVSLIATIYPALLGASVPPVVAMQGKE